MKLAILILFCAARCFAGVLPANGLTTPIAIAPGLYGGTTSLVGWYDRKGLTNYTKQAVDGSSVGAWINNLPYSHTMDLSNSTANPLFSNIVAGASPGVFFNGTTMFLNTSTNGPSTLGGTNFTVFFLISTNSLISGHTLAHLVPTNSTDVNGTEFWNGGPGDTPEWDVLRGSAQSTYRGPSYTNGIRGAPRWCILSALFGVATNDIEAWFNSNTNSLAPQLSNGNPGPMAETNRVFYLSKRGNQGSFSPMQVLEVLIYNKKLLESERFAVEQYLRHKYGAAKIP